MEGAILIETGIDPPDMWRMHPGADVWGARSEGPHLAFKIGVVVPCHNDGRFLRKSLPALKADLEGFESRILVVIDRSTDESSEVARGMGVETLVKGETTWRNSTSENRNLGFIRLMDSDFLAVVDADTLVSPGYFRACVVQLRAKPSHPSAGGAFWSTSVPYRMYQLGLTRLGLRQGVRGTGRVYAGTAIRRCFAEDGFVFRDRIAEDTDLDVRLTGRGYSPRLFVPDAVMFDLREFSFRKSVAGQLRLGRAYRELGRSFASLSGEIARGRFLVVLGYWS